MAIRNSTNVSTLSVTDQPDWESGVDTVFVYETNVFTSRSNLEQRTRRRKVAHIDISWRLRGLTKTEIDSRAERDLLEANTPCIVPFWSHAALVNSNMVSSTLVVVDRTPIPEFFRAGDWIYLYSAASGGQFRQVASQGSPTTQLTLAAMTGATLYQAGAYVWPCRTCEKVVDGSDIQRDHLQTFQVLRRFRTIGE